QSLRIGDAVSQLRRDPPLRPHADVAEVGTAKSLDFGAIEVGLAGDQRDTEAVNNPLPQPGFFPQIACRTDRHDAPEILRQREANRTGDAAAAGKAADVGAIGVDAVV